MAYRTLPKSWTKKLVQAVLDDPVGRLASLEPAGEHTPAEFGHIEVVVGNRHFYCTDVHEGSFYFRGFGDNDRTVRVSTHWRCKCSRKVDQYYGSADIPEISGKIETYRGFAAVMY